MHHAIFLALQRGMGKKAEMTEAVVDCHDNHAARGQRFTVIGRQATRAHGKPAAVQPHHNRKRPATVNGRPNVQIEAIFREGARIAPAQLLTILAALPA